MSELIPTYQLQAFATPAGESDPAVYFPDYGGVKPTIPLHQPYRGDYYKISLCLRGRAELKVNLAPFVVTPGCLVLATPDVIKEWGRVSEDYETLSVFFTRDFISTHHAATGKLHFLVAPPTPVLSLASAEAAGIAASFRFLQQKYAAASPQRDNIVKSILGGLLYEIGALYEQPAGSGQHHSSNPGQSRARQLAAGFRQLLQTHCGTERSVQFYAAALCITPKHLTELVKDATGRTASEWIAEAVALEAKALLQNPALTVAQVAQGLQFTDQFAFSRFFKRSTGLSPTAYRQAG
ncbi:AraC family transcriptional regulator [Hymenobacter chitinivorans]|uniref:AraC-like DNA-binding protein n=1 Tax=Hymenobacter chitinivorans DSM 11115 TaxID=1121954 RepID=A0A2M9B5N2_9BACT|nr:helix-turn-helix domain-containing protein [Hymenobacter chitinivorans]PJJ53252.1 AraC-like DNA-binding protein [Hymenobacter chitinivorans DSM 11115]